MAERIPRLFLALLAALTLAVAAHNLHRPLANPDEGRYSEIAREMAVGGDWVTPRLNGIEYLEKPPLQYWATAAALRALGATEPAARLYVALCALATLIVLAFTAARVGPREAGMAVALALLSSPYFVLMSGIVTLDMGLTFWTTLTFCALLLGERAAHRGGGARWMLLAWAAMALAVLSKGLVGLIIPAAAIGLHALLRRDFSTLGRLQWGFGAVLFLGIAAPWFVLVSFANPEFPRFFFVHEHFERFLTDSHRREEPWWYFLPIVALGFLPWLLALPSALWHAWRDDSREPGSGAGRFAVVWSVFVVAFFSLSGSKLPAYVLPAFPPLAFVLGRYLARAPCRTLALRLAPMVLAAAALAVATWLAPDRAREAWVRELHLEARPWLLAGAGAFAALTLAGPLLLWRGRRWTALTAVATGMVIVVACGAQAFERFSPRQSGHAIAAKMKPFVTPATRLYSVRHYDQTVPFYVGRTFTLVEYRDEFGPGLRSRPGRHLDRLEEFPDEWLRPGEALAIMQPGTYESLLERGLPMQLLHEDPRRVLVRKP